MRGSNVFSVINELACFISMKTRIICFASSVLIFAIVLSQLEEIIDCLRDALMQMNELEPFLMACRGSEFGTMTSPPGDLKDF